MESWRQELYQSLTHSIEGSSWKDHKYVAIVNGRYIYPEDLKENSSRTSSNPNTKSYDLILDKEQGDKTKTISTKVDVSKITKKDKGYLRNKNYLPTNPEVGDMYILSDTGQQIVWTGNEWGVVKTIAKAAANVAANVATVGAYGSGSGSKEKKSSNSNSGLSAETMNKLRTLLKNYSIKSKSAQTAVKSKGSKGGGGR